MDTCLSSGPPLQQARLVSGPPALVHSGLLWRVAGCSLVVHQFQHHPAESFCLKYPLPLILPAPPVESPSSQMCACRADLVYVYILRADLVYKLLSILAKFTEIQHSSLLYIFLSRCRCLTRCAERWGGETERESVLKRQKREERGVHAHAVSRKRSWA